MFFFHFFFHIIYKKKIEKKNIRIFYIISYKLFDIILLLIMNIIDTLKANKIPIINFFLINNMKKSTALSYFMLINNLDLKLNFLNCSEIKLLLENNKNRYKILYAFIKILRVYNLMHNNIFNTEIIELQELLIYYFEIKKNMYLTKEKIKFQDIINKWQMFKILKNDEKYVFNISMEVKYVILSIYYYLQPLNNADLIKCNKSNIIENQLYLSNEKIDLPQELLKIINNFFVNSKQDLLFPQLKLYKNNIYKSMKMNNFITLIKTIFPEKQCSLILLKQLVAKK